MTKLQALESKRILINAEQLMKSKGSPEASSSVLLFGEFRISNFKVKLTLEAQAEEKSRI